MADHCVGGCGFFGSAEKQGYCSVCYKNALTNGKIVESAVKIENVVPLSVAAEKTEASESLQTSECPAPTLEGSNKVQVSGRCYECNKKIGLTGFDCRCGFTFCAQHRYVEAHSCPFDYKTFQQAELAKKNEQVVAEKLEKV